MVSSENRKFVFWIRLHVVSAGLNMPMIWI